jgi:hypothetical protein
MRRLPIRDPLISFPKSLEYSFKFPRITLPAHSMTFSHKMSDISLE